jgi:hypothetical protein
MMIVVITAMIIVMVVIVVMVGVRSVAGLIVNERDTRIAAARVGNGGAAVCLHTQGGRIGNQAAIDANRSHGIADAKRVPGIAATGHIADRDGAAVCRGRGNAAVAGTCGLLRGRVS